jgi:hypothetical protein
MKELFKTLAGEKSFFCIKNLEKYEVISVQKIHFVKFREISQLLVNHMTW